MHNKKSYKPADLKTNKAYQDLITQTFEVYDRAIQDNVVSNDLKKALQSDVFLVAGLKTHAQLFEASTLLMKDDGTIKSYAELEQDFNRLNIAYNRNYLESEYQFATSSAQMADKWQGFDDSTDYNLQYRTAQDERVRESHEKLANITLPKKDAFWSSFYPPNGWRCRCTVVEVSKDKYEKSDAEESFKKGEVATTQLGKDGKNKLALFRFNSGKEERIFPKDMPYTKVKGAKEVKEILTKK